LNLPEELLGVSGLLLHLRDVVLVELRDQLRLFLKLEFLFCRDGRCDFFVLEPGFLLLLLNDWLLVQSSFDSLDLQVGLAFLDCFLGLSLFPDLLHLGVLVLQELFLYLDELRFFL